MSLDVQALRAQFPALQQQVNGKELVYLDNGATTQKPLSVLQALEDYYRQDNSNVHRGAHALADRATRAFEAARDKVANFLNAARREEIVWTRGTTEAINLVAQSWGRHNLQAGDHVVISVAEHHANIVPWQRICAERGAQLTVIPVTPDGALDRDAFAEALQAPVKMVSLLHVSNAMGTVNPVAELIRQAHEAGAKVLLDGAQAVGHFPVDVQALDVDFYVASGHKMFGPTGVGFLYGKYDLLDAMPPWQTGGEMIERVSFAETTFQPPPLRFEAGTPNIAGVIGLGAAVDFLLSLDREAMMAHEEAVFAYACARAGECEGMQRLGGAPGSLSALSFNLEGVNAHDLGMLLDQQGVAVRTGHHCTQPLMAFFGIEGTVRASFSLYNTQAEVDTFFDALARARALL